MQLGLRYEMHSLCTYMRSGAWNKMPFDTFRHIFVNRGYLIFEKTNRLCVITIERNYHSQILQKKNGMFLQLD